MNHQYPLKEYLKKCQGEGGSEANETVGQACSEPVKEDQVARVVLWISRRNHSSALCDVVVGTEKGTCSHACPKLTRFIQGVIFSCPGLLKVLMSREWQVSF